MTITHLGAKRLQGTKQDRKSDSLGSSADGTNSGITLLNSATGGTDLTSSSQSWTQVGTEIVKTNDTITATNASDDDSNGSTGSDRVHTTLPSTLSNTKHTTDFDLRITANASSGDPDIVPIMYTAGTSAFGAGSQDGYGFDMYSDTGNGNNYVVRLIARDGTDNDYSSGIVLTPTTQYYCRLVRNSATLGTLNVYTDSARTTHTSGSPQTLTIASGSDRGKDCTHLQSSTWSGSGQTSYVVENVKLYNDKVVGDPKLGTGAYSFDGSNDKVLLGSASDWKFLSDATANTWSIAWWMIYNDTLENGHTIMSTTDGSTQNDGFFIDNSGSGTLRLIQVDGDDGSWSSAIPDNTSWHHYAITWNAGTVTLYVDGVSKGTQSQTAGSGTPQYPLTLGANNDEYFTALTLDDIGIYKRVLSSTEIGKLYNNNSAGNLTKDAQATTNTSSSGTTITNSSFTVANNSNRILIVCAYRYGSGGDISGITWNSSESFTRATFRDGSTETGRTEIWYLVNPTATTSNIVTTWDASTSRRGAGVYSFYNAKQTSPIGATAYDDETATVTDGAITPTVAGSMIVDCIGSGSNGAPTDSLTAGWTSLIGGDDRIHSSQYNLTPTISSANTMAWTFVSDKGVNWIAVEVKSANPTGSSAQLVSSLTNKSELKANYTMDTAKPISAPTSQITTVNTGQQITQGADQLRRIDLQDSNYLGEALGNTWTIRCVMDTQAISLPTDNNYQSRAFGMGLSSTEVSVTSNSDRINWGFRTWDSNGADEPDNIWGYSQKNNGHGYGMEQFTTNLVPSVAKYYVEINRLSDTSLTMTIRTDSHSGTIVRQQTFTGLPSDVTGLRYLQFYQYRESANNNTTVTLVCSDIEIWNSSTSASGTADATISCHDFGCNNDFSSTSDLLAMTNLPVNTIFEQTDDTPSYWWKQSDNTWALDGSVGTDISSGGWSTSGSQNAISEASGVITFNVPSSNTGDTLFIKSLPATAGSSWVVRYKLDITQSNYSGGGSGNHIVGISDSFSRSGSGEDPPSSSKSMYLKNTYHSDKKFAQYWTNGSTSGNDWSNGVTLSGGAQTWYVTIANNGGSITTRYGANSDYTGGSITSAWTVDSTTQSASKTKIFISTYASSSMSGGAFIGTISDLTFYNNRSSVPS